MVSLLFDLLQIATGNRDSLTVIPTETDWEATYMEAKRQGVTGLCFIAIQRLLCIYADRRFGEPLGFAKQTYLQWLASAANIEKQSDKLLQAYSTIQDCLLERGMKFCFLKGATIGVLYGDMASYRETGDVDVWVDATKDDIVNLVRGLNGDRVSMTGIHVSCRLINRVEVEFHFRPLSIASPILGRRANKFYSINKPRQMSNTITLKNGTHLYAPDKLFNTVYVLHHTYKHLLFEGIGMRQVIDCYFVLSQIISSEEQSSVMNTMKYLGLNRFTGAMSYVLHDTLGYELSFVPENENCGKLVLGFICDEGNLGNYDVNRRHDRWNSSLYRFLYHTKRQMMLWRISPWEIFWSPLYRIKEYLWRMTKGNIE